MQQLIDMAEILRTFENQPTLHLLKLIAGDLDGTHYHKDIRRARANWLRDLIGALSEILEEDAYSSAMQDAGGKVKELLAEMHNCDSCSITGLLCPIRNQDPPFSFPCPHWKPLK